jgi:hypothetical protein
VPFTQVFQDVTGMQRSVFFAAFICTTAALILLIAPSAYHRLRWRQRDKEQLLRTSNTLAIVGTIFLALAVTATVFLVTDLMYSSLSAAIVSAAVAGALAWFWFGLPLLRRVQEPREAA